MSDGTEHTNEYREEEVDAGSGQVVVIQEYPGGDMTIFTSCSELYFNSDEASALRTALGKIDGQKRSVEPKADQEGGDR
jgi:hypothetical protein